MSFTHPIRLIRTFSLGFSLIASAMTLVALPVSAYAQDTPEQVASIAAAALPESGDAVKTSQASININSANAMLLSEKLKGIGMKKAEAIIRYREVNGSFTSVSDLLKVKGIGKSILKRNKDRIVI